MSQALEVGYLKPFIESTIDAAARFRRVLIVMVTASILAFGAFWNSLNETWFNSRLATASAGEAYLQLEEIRARLAKTEQDLKAMEEKEAEEKKKQELQEKRKELTATQEQLLADAMNILKVRFHEVYKDVKSAMRILPLARWYFLSCDKVYKGTDITNAEGLGNELANGDYENAKEWINQRRIFNLEQAKEYREKLEDLRTENILLIHIPLSGSVFDVNSLGLWAGITFMVILLVFRFSLWREYNNLRLTFKEAKTEHLRFCYRSLAMQQVLTVPPALSQRQPLLKPQGKVVQLLYFPPVLIQLAIIRNDIRTEAIGKMFGSNLAPVSTSLSAILLGFIIVLTLRCLILSYAIDKEWEVAAERVRAALLQGRSTH